MAQPSTCDSPEQRLEQAVLEWLQAADRGEHLSVPELQQRFPDVAEEIESLVATMQTVDQMADGSTQVKQIDLTDVAVDASELDSRASASDPLRMLADVFSPDFELLDTLGRGAVGMVFKARQTVLCREVALKVLLLGQWASEADRARFRTEARALAQLRHPAIVTVFSSGQANGWPYLEMEFVQGGTLGQLILQEPMSPKGAAKVVRQVAEGIAEAHRLGILHRDLKPSNVLIEGDSGLARITDFGLARFAADRDHMTQTGQIVGTPCYMAPEQAHHRGNVGPAADIYGLGAILYATVTGRPPHRSGSAPETLRLLEEQDPVAPRMLNPMVPRDLETICLKCLRKDPRHRYETADAVAADLDCFLNDRPISARPVNSFERLMALTRRNPLSAGLIAFTIVLLVAGMTATVQWSAQTGQMNDQLREQNGQLDEALNALRELRREDQAKTYRLRQLVYAADMKQALAAWQQHDTRKTASLLAAHKPGLGLPDVRCFLWHYLDRANPEPIAEVGNFDHAAYCVTWSPANDCYAVCGADGWIRLFEPESNSLVLKFDSGQREVNSVVFTADGRELLSAGDDGTVKRWTLPRVDDSSRQRSVSLQPTSVISVLEDRPVFGVALLRDGAKLVACGTAPEAFVFDLKTGQMEATLSGAHTRRIEALAVSADGRHLLTVGHDDAAACWDTESYERLARSTESRSPLSCVSFVGDGTFFATGSLDGRVRLMSTETCELLGEYERPDAIQQLSRLDQSRLLVADRGGAVTILQLERHGDGIHSKAVRTLQADTERIYGLAVAPDGGSFLATGRSGRLNRWAVHHPSAVQVLGTPDAVSQVRSFPAVAVAEDEVWLCRSCSLERFSPSMGLGQPVLTSGPTFVSCDATPDAAVRVVVRTPAVVFVQYAAWPERSTTYLLGDSEDVVRDIRLLPDRSEALVRRRHGRLQLLDLETGEVSTIRERCDALAVSPNGQSVWMAEKDTNDLLKLDASSFQQQLRLPACRTTVRTLAVSPDGRRIAAAGHDRSLSIWRTSDGELLNRVEGLPEAFCNLAWSPDNLAIAACTGGSTIRLFQASTLRDLGQIEAEQSGFEAVGFTRNGHYLYGVSSDSTMSWFDGRPRIGEL